MASAAGSQSHAPSGTQGDHDMSGRSSHATAGRHKQHRTLVKGDQVSMRLWRVGKGEEADDTNMDRTYAAQHDAVLYCVEGAAELHVEGSSLQLSAGDSWTVPARARHTYKVTSNEPFVAVEACHPACD